MQQISWKFRIYFQTSFQFCQYNNGNGGALWCWWSFKMFYITRATCVEVYVTSHSLWKLASMMVCWIFDLKIGYSLKLFRTVRFRRDETILRILNDVRICDYSEKFSSGLQVFYFLINYSPHADEWSLYGKSSVTSDQWHIYATCQWKTDFLNIIVSYSPWKDKRLKEKININFLTM